MSNSLLTIDMITREALRLFRNSNAFLRRMDTQYDDYYARTGGKIGDTLRVRLPNDYVLRRGQTASPQDTVEQEVPVVMANQVGVDLNFTSAEQTLSLDDFSKRILAPAINTVAGGIASDLMGMAEGVCNYVSNVDGSGNVTTPTANTWLLAGAALDQNNAPRGDRVTVLDPLTQARTVSSLSGLFNPQGKVSDQFRSGMMATDTLGFDWMMDQTTILHTTAAYGTLPTVSGANQTGSSITVSTTTAPLNKGDIITIAGVNAVNRVTKQSYGTLRQFAVTANVATGSTSIPIYPALIPPSSGNPVAYQTVDASPANGAVISVVTKASEKYRKNLAFVPDAFTMVTADLPLPNGVNTASRQSYDGVSIRIIQDYIPTTDVMLTRLDILYGFALLRPEWACAVADAV